MPVYEYRCNACGHEFERTQRMSDEPVKVCPECNEVKVERLISLTSFHLKGGGWYSDLYSSSKGGNATKKEAAAGESKSEAKPEAKAETKYESPTKTETKSSDTKTVAK